MSSVKFVVSALDAILASKEAQKNKELADSSKKALDAIKEHGKLPNPEIVFTPLQLATRSNDAKLTTSALDCIGKLISYSYFSVSSKEDEEDEVDQAPPLIERAIDTICDCFEGESTPVDIQLQIVKSLLAAVLNDKIVVHGAGLLKAVRQVYNVFLLSRSTANQQVAQGTLTQMVGTVFERVKTRLHMKETRLTAASEALNSPDRDEDHDEDHDEEHEDRDEAQGDQHIEHEKAEDDTSDAQDLTNADVPSTETPDNEPSESKETNGSAKAKLTLKDLEHRKSFDDSNLGDGPTTVTRLRFAKDKDDNASVSGHSVPDHPAPDDLEALEAEDEVYIRDAYLVFRSFCNLSTKVLPPDQLSVDRVFEVCCEIFWLMLKFMRPSFKKEIEVILNEIYLALLSRKNGPLSQKIYFVTILNRMCADPRALVETYLNYDCGQGVDNIYQTIIEDLSKFATAPVTIASANEQIYEETRAKTAPPSEWQLKPVLPPSLDCRAHPTNSRNRTGLSKGVRNKRLSLEALVEALRSLVNWSAPLHTETDTLQSRNEDTNPSMEELRPSFDPTLSELSPTPLGSSTPTLDDDPDHLEKEKARKTALTNAIRQFNFKPKTGIKLLLRDGFISQDTPESIAQFLSDGGETRQANRSENTLARRRFVDALRHFLQSFRLPGEAQKIDRFMLKFAERYVLGNPKAFANADTAYVLAYSVVMLNTDQHSKNVVRRMTKEDFIKNNRGINDNADLPDEYLIGIFDEIASNEIVLTSEREAAAAAGPTPAQPSGIAAGLGQAFSSVGRDLQREAYVQQSEEISLRSEALFKTLFKSQRRNAKKDGVKYIPATSFKHVGPMFDVTWMCIFSALSGQIQKAHNIEVNKLCLEGMKLSTKIACAFDLSTPREAFMTALKNATNLNNPQEMLAKNIEALKTILDLGSTEGNVLRESWKDILLCISQLDRLQLISEGVDENAIPDVSKARFKRTDTTDSRSSTQSRSKSRHRASTVTRGFSSEIASETKSDEIIRSVDRIFTNTANLSGDAMVFFAKALTEVSWDEIKVSGSNDSPRTYSLQKIVEISYYNMNRIRFEWSNIWEVFGEHFNRVGCHNNLNIVFFALDSLRQLSMRFMEIEELAGFKFQKDFLKPFEHILATSNNPTVKDMILQCLIQMIQARGDMIRSGWRTMFGVFTVAAREPYEAIVNLAFENVNQVYKTKFGVVISQGAFTDLIVCLTEFSKNLKFQKKGLQALELLKSIVPTMLKTPECPLSQKQEGYWFPVLFAFHDVLMTGEDLEVRSNALEYFFDTLIKYGGGFPPEFWDILWRQQLYPIFMVLRSRPEMTNALNHEELSVWLSTTMIQALRNMITLFTHYFSSLEYMLDRFLELLALCICQENDTISRIGSNCLQQMILKNVDKFNKQHWTKIVGAFCELFERTTAHQLFTAAAINSTATLSPPEAEFVTPASSPLPEGVAEEQSKTPKTNGADDASTVSDADNESVHHGLPSKVNEEDFRISQSPQVTLEEFKPNTSLQQQPVVVTAARRRFFNRIISRCVLQLLMIETVNELFSNEAVYAHIPSLELLRLMSLLKRSFQFARRFNDDKELRMRLWREGFMKQPPNLLKQESGSAATYCSILFRMYADNDPERRKSRDDVEAALVPLCKDIVSGYTALEEESQQRNIAAWRPVVVDVLEGYASFPEESFKARIPDFYPMTVDLLGKDLTPDLRSALLLVLR
ncbi:unnamed protein product, partial [Clonostachys rosea f. rosea IK726]